MFSQILILSDYTDFNLPESAKQIKRNNEENYVLWKNEDIVKLLKENFEPKVLTAYESLNSNAFKADLARYCILYTYGGWYSDLLMTIDGNLGNNVLSQYDMLIFRDMPWDRTILAVSNSIIWVKKKNNIILKNTIEECTNNILNKIYPRTSHRITGPVVFGSQIAKRSLEYDDVRILVGDLSYCNEKHKAEFTVVDNKERSRVHFAWHRLPGMENSLPNTYQKSSSYSVMYKEKKLYK
jgi:mannosyltransferase OCH1-like enzyme